MTVSHESENILQSNNLIYEPQAEKLYKTSKKIQKWFFSEKWLYKSKLSSGKVWLQCDDGK